MAPEPRTLMEAVRYFADPDVALQHMVELRWGGTPTCPTCGRVDVRFIATRRLWECKEKHERRQFSAKVGTIFEDSAIPLDKWFVAIWMVANCKNGISSYEMARSLGITQKSACEADETFVGGLAKNMHRSRRKLAITGSGPVGKTAVFGILQRSRGENPSRVRANVVPDVSRNTLQRHIRSTVKPGTMLYTDAMHSYRGLTDFAHAVIDHTVEYVNGHIHTNSVENFWSLLKRSIKGTYISVEPFHLGRYVDEQVFRFNERDGSDADRFTAALRRIFGKRLTYRELTSGTVASAA